MWHGCTSDHGDHCMAHALVHILIICGMASAAMSDMITAWTGAVDAVIVADHGFLLFSLPPSQGSRESGDSRGCSADSDGLCAGAGQCLSGQCPGQTAEGGTYMYMYTLCRPLVALCIRTHVPMCT